jgi:hypothetical protein
MFTKLENKMTTENEIGFSRLNLKLGDDLIIKVNTSGLSEEDSVKKLKEISDDDFLKYVTERGHRVFVTYTGVDLEILVPFVTNIYFNSTIFTFLITVFIGVLMIRFW